MAAVQQGVVGFPSKDTWEGHSGQEHMEPPGSKLQHRAGSRLVLRGGWLIPPGVLLHSEFRQIAA